MQNLRLTTEINFDRALGVLDVVQVLFTQNIDAPPSDESIYYSLLIVRQEIETIKELIRLNSL